MSTFSLARGPRGILGAFESSGQIRWAALDAGEQGEQAAELDSRAAPGEGAGRKHPSLACAADGSTLLAWIEGMGWGKGGTLAWQLFDPEGKPLEGWSGRRDGVPAWSLVQAVALPDGRFVLFY